MTKIETKFLPENNILLVKISGKYKMSKSNKTQVGIVGIIDELLDRECSKLLVDYRDADYSIEPSAVMNRSELFHSHGLPSLIKAAVLYQDNNADAYFVETVMQNRGWRMKIFFSMNEAMNWLG